MLIRQWRHSAGRIILIQRFVKKEKVGKSSPHGEFGFLERLEVGLVTKLTLVLEVLC
jgi:hypothetical protein